MTTPHGRSRRRFVKQMGATAGMLAFQAEEAAAQAPALPEETPRSVHPTLNRRTRGWLRFLWEKATTPDDWNADGVPHMWWDRYSNPVVTSYGRFDLHNSSYALLLMADRTPAWREVYARIADGLASRYPTYWGAVDWLTQIGDDPRRESYPPRVMAAIPERLRGRYNRIGWTANGIEPWGLSPDPIGSEGNLFFRGWFNLVLGIYKYVSGDDKYERPFPVTGYGDERFEWDQHRIAALLESQYRERPEGPHCENTKIWFPCNSAAGLGMFLYDRLYGRDTHRPVQGWLEYARDNFIGTSRDGRLEWVTSYYDPIVNHKANGGPGAGVGVAFLLLPQDRETATLLYESAANALGWNDPSVEIRASTTGTVMARELGDHTSLARLRAAAEREYDPRFFGERNEKFGWWFGLNEAYPRGQSSASMMVAEVGDGDAWNRAFDAPAHGQVRRPHRRGRRLPGPRRLPGLERRRERRPPRRHLRGGARAARRRHELAGDQPARPRRRLHPVRRGAVLAVRRRRAERHPHRRRPRPAPVPDFHRLPGPDPRQAEARRQDRRRRAAAAAGVAAGAGPRPDRPRRDTRQATASFSPGNGPTCACCTA